MSKIHIKQYDFTENGLTTPYAAISIAVGKQVSASSIKRLIGNFKEHSALVKTLNALDIAYDIFPVAVDSFDVTIESTLMEGEELQKECKPIEDKTVTDIMDAFEHCATFK